VQPDSVVIGSGPNGLAAAIVLAQAGRSVRVFEADRQIGGGVRSAMLTVPGFVHDVCSAVHPFARASPFFRTLPLDRYGLDWIDPPVMIAHPFDDGPSAAVYRDVGATAIGLGADGHAYRLLIEPIVDNWRRLEPTILGPLAMPRYPVTAARFAAQALRSANAVARSVFTTDRARALFAGIAAHGMLPLDTMLTAGIGLVLGAMAHVVGWPIPKGGAGQIADALAAHLTSLGGNIVTDAPVASIDEVRFARTILCDLSPRPLLKIAGHRFPPRYRNALARYRYGMGAFKIDWALRSPVPWRDPICTRAATIHLGGSFDEIGQSEADAWTGRITDRPFVIAVQPSLFDPDRAPAGKHTFWAYCHVPHASAVDMTARIERQIERFAPGFRDAVLGRHVMAPADLERHNPNLVGGDIASGVTDIRQFFTRPTWRRYSTPLSGVYICSAATPPGVGVHGMCGYFAARTALRAR